MDEDEFFKRVKTCEAKYAQNETAKYVIFSSENNLFLGIVIYSYRQLKNGKGNGTVDVMHLPAKTEKDAIDKCEEWIKSNINSQVICSCV